MAALVAAGVVLSGCASAGGGDETTTTSPTAAQTPGNPWDLPIEQRPALFDPCAEIPVSAIEEGIGGSVESIESLTRHEPMNLMSCGWRNSEVQITALATWKSRDAYLADPAFTVQDLEFENGQTSSLRLVEKGDQTGTCLRLFFTEKGTVWIKLDSIHSLKEFKGEKFVEACAALDQVMTPIVPLIPRGNFE